MIKTSKISVMFPRCFIPCFRCLCGVKKQADMYIASFDLYFCAPLIERLTPGYAFVSGCIVRLTSAIALLLAVAGLSEIFPAIIKAVTVHVVAITESCYQEMHHYCGTILFRMAHGIKSLFAMYDKPVPPIKPFEIGHIDNRILSLRKWNQLIGLVLRLDDFVSKYTRFGHCPTSNGALLPAAIVTYGGA